MIKCFWALSAINMKNDKRVTSCPRNHGTMHDLSKNKIPSQYINSEGFKEFRKTLLKGEWPWQCASCRDFESKNLRSYRQKEEDRWRDDMLNGLNPKTGSIELSNIEHIELRFSNACNLSCLHCTPSYSSKWQSILLDHEPTEDDKKYKIQNLLDKSNNQSWTLKEVDYLLEDLITNFPNLNRLDISGGEPLYQKQFWRFLEGIVHHPNIANTDIVMISNFNTEVDYERLSELLMPFKKSCIRISVDGGNKIYKYFRSGVYDNISKNIATFRKKNTKTSIEATNTISIYQLLDFKNTITDMSQIGADWLHHSHVQYPSYLSPSVLPNKAKVLEEIESSIEILDKSMSREMKRSIRKMIELTIEFVNKYSFVEKDREALLHYTQRMDEIKNQSFEKVYGKQLWEFLNE